MVRYWGKRTLDLAGSLAALVLFSPVMLIVAGLVAWRMGRPILFQQVRLGYREQPFTMLKFRTMTGETDASGIALPDCDRLTALGHFLRDTSLDELPGLFNVVRGEMSLVGPRPLLVEYGPYYTDQERLRFQVRPGITGWAQVNGRNDIAWDRRLEYDVWYVKHISFWLDVRILLLTVLKVLQRSNVRADPTHVSRLDDERKSQRTTVSPPAP